MLTGRLAIFMGVDMFGRLDARLGGKRGGAGKKDL